MRVDIDKWRNDGHGQGVGSIGMIQWSDIEQLSTANRQTHVLLRHLSGGHNPGDVERVFGGRESIPVVDGGLSEVREPHGKAGG